jgi:hypothetical protein
MPRARPPEAPPCSEVMSTWPSTMGVALVTPGSARTRRATSS